MSIQTCPTTIVEASADRVWRLLTIPGEFQRWTGLRMMKGPGRPLAAGDRVGFFAGLLRLQVISLERPRRLELEVHLPFGIVNHPVIVITPQSDGTCRVTYN